MAELTGYVSAVLALLLLAVMPGAALVSLLFERNSSEVPPEALSSASLLIGLLWFFPLQYSLRLALTGRPGVWSASLAASAVPVGCALLSPRRRQLLLAALRDMFSLRTGVFLLLALPLAAFLTYRSLAGNHWDELFRFSLAAASVEKLPVANICSWTGNMRYHLGAEYFAGTLSFLSGLPVEITYFRCLIPLSWLLMYLAMSALPARGRLSKWSAHAAFCLLFLAHFKILIIFLSKPLAFALGLAALSAAYVVYAVPSGGPAAAICVLLPAFVTLVKAPVGALLLLLMAVFFSQVYRRGRLSGAAFAALTVCSGALWLAAMHPVSSAGLGSADILRFGSRPDWLREFLPELLYRYGFGGGVEAPLPSFIENSVSVLMVAALPLSLYALGRYAPAAAGGQGEPVPRTPALPALICLAASAFLHVFTYYSVSGGSRLYWLTTGLYLASFAAYPAAVESLSAIGSRRLWLTLLLCAAVSVVLAAPPFPLLRDISLSGGAAALAVCGSFWIKWLKTGKYAAGVFVSGAILFVFAHQALGLTGSKYFPLYAVWIPAVCSYPLLSAASAFPAAGRRAVTLLLLPLAVALSHAPKILYWTSIWPPVDNSGHSVLSNFTVDNIAACEYVSSSLPAGSALVFNETEQFAPERYFFSLSAFCGRRAFVTYGLPGVWDDKAVHTRARIENGLFWSGKLKDVCGWTRARNIGGVYYDRRGKGKPPPASGAGGAFREAYRNADVSVYVPDCQGGGR